MPYTPPTLEECVQNSRLDFEAELPGSNAWLWPNNVSISAKVIGALIWGCYRFVAYVLKQVLVTTCDVDWLPRHGAEYGVIAKPAVQAKGFIDVTGLPGVTFGIGDLWARGDGVQFTTDVATVIPGGGSVSVPVTAVTAGAIGASIDGSPFTTAQSDLLSSAVANDISGGADEEGADDYRERILERKREPPSVGNVSDYKRWSKEIPGVTRAFVARTYGGPGRVGVWFMMDGTYSDGIPLSGDVAILQAYLEDTAPADATILVYAPTALPITITITSLQPDTPATRQKVIDELAGEFQRRAFVGIVGTETFSISWINEAISRAVGENRHILTVPSVDPVIGVGEIPTLGVVTFA